MAKDPAVLWYWNDWIGGTLTFSRALKGAYMDLLGAQHNNGHLSLDEIKTVLGSDFGSMWPTLQKKFAKDDEGLYYNKRAKQEKEARQNFTSSRRKNLKGKSSHTDDHMEDRDEDINTHSVFSLRLLSKEGELDKEAIEVSTRVFVTEQLLKEFNANLRNSETTHLHFSEYKKHLVRWIPKKPKAENGNNTSHQRKGHDITNIGNAADEVLRIAASKFNPTGDSGDFEPVIAN